METAQPQPLPKIPPPKLWFTAPQAVTYKAPRKIEIEMVPIKKTEYEKCVDFYPQNPELCVAFLKDTV